MKSSLSKMVPLLASCLLLAVLVTTRSSFALVWNARQRIITVASSSRNAAAREGLKSKHKNYLAGLFPLLASQSRGTAGLFDDDAFYQREELRTSKNISSLLVSLERRRLLSAALPLATLWTMTMEKADAAATFGLFPRQGTPSSLYAVSPERNTTTLRGPVLDTKLPALDELSSELCLLRLLPVKNPFFRELQARLEGISSLRASAGIPDSSWERASKTIQTLGVEELDKRRSSLQPVFIPDEDTLMQISKAERFEQRVESLRNDLEAIANATARVNATETFLLQKRALFTLSEIGELLVAKFPYEVPSEGIYSYLPRLLGRCRVAFTFRRNKKILGNITIVADGYTAPITAGNFVDLSARGFYTGLPIKFAKKRLGSGSEFEVAQLPILGSYNEGFYDPLTAKPRRLPLELIRVEKGSGEPDLTYSQGLTQLSEKGAVLEPTLNSRPLLSFRIPGLVAMSHPEKNPNGASSEFFCLQDNSVAKEKRGLFDGDFAPFGYIVEGLDVFQRLKAGDVIDDTTVSPFGLQSLVKLRRSSFSEVVQGSSEQKEENKDTNNSTADINNSTKN